LADAMTDQYYAIYHPEMELLYGNTVCYQGHWYRLQKYYCVGDQRFAPVMNDGQTHPHWKLLSFAVVPPHVSRTVNDSESITESLTRVLNEAFEYSGIKSQPIHRMVMDFLIIRQIPIVCVTTYGNSLTLHGIAQTVLGDAVVPVKIKYNTTDNIGETTISLSESAGPTDVPFGYVGSGDFDGFHVISICCGCLSHTVIQQGETVVESTSFTKMHLTRYSIKWKPFVKCNAPECSYSKTALPIDIAETSNIVFAFDNLQDGHLYIRHLTIHLL
jgi:hypothetical protein